MDEWKIMFAKVQALTRNALPLKQHLTEIITFALDNPTVFDKPEYWREAEEHDFQPAFETLTGWARQGLAGLEPQTGWQFLLLDLGDCPEIFQLYRPGGQDLMAEQSFRRLLSKDLIVGPSDMLECFVPAVADPFGNMFGEGRVNLSSHHVSELRNSFLDWTADAGMDFHGMNGYLLWLALGSLALITAVREGSARETILRGRDRLYLLAGYEEIFFSVATVTPASIIHESA